MSSGAAQAAFTLVNEPGFGLPRPGLGATRQRWTALAQHCRDDVATGRLVEAHADADAILGELGGHGVRSGQFWGVWAAEPPAPRVTAKQSTSGWTLTGDKPWCSGSLTCTHALVTADATDDQQGGSPLRRMFAVDLAQDGVLRHPVRWASAGMHASDTGTVSFDHVRADAVGAPGSYLDRPGFWHGGIGVAACWFGGAQRVAEVMYRSVNADSGDIKLTHLGAVEALLASGDAILNSAAQAIDDRPGDLALARRLAFTARWSIEQVATAVIDRVGRALGPRPLVEDDTHARAVADLQIYLRQSHAEFDLCALGRLCTAESARHPARSGGLR